ncbi:MAG: alkaline phosphatase family protein, partial [Candidatus Baltobacteraceae bacterium]
SGSPIQHVIFIVQENRSFNNLFMGYPNALTQNYGYDSSGNRIALHPQSFAEGWDIDHSATAFFTAFDHGKLDGWNNERACCGKIPNDFAYGYVPRRLVRPYWQMAGQYVLADHMFQSNLDGSFIAHQYVIAGYASHAVNFPSSVWGCPGGPNDVVTTLNPNRSYGPSISACFDNQTIGDEMDQAGLSWKFYTASLNGNGNLWSSYQAIAHIYNGPDWSADVIDPQSRFVSDVANGQLANVTWITPTFGNSDHTGGGSNSGPAWVSSLVNAVGKSSFWNSSAIFIIWDDWGGWFDPVKPVYRDYDGLGFRIPMLVISPYAKQGVVAHRQYETSSVLKFIEDTFGLPSLAASDARALDPAAEALDFTQQPRAFQPFASARPLQYWRMQPATRSARTPAFGD